MRFLDYEGGPKTVYQLARIADVSDEELADEDALSEPHSSDNELEGLLRRTSAKAENIDDDEDLQNW